MNLVDLTDLQELSIAHVLDLSGKGVKSANSMVLSLPSHIAIHTEVATPKDQDKIKWDLAAWMPKFEDNRITSTAVVFIPDCSAASKNDELLLVNMFPARESDIAAAKRHTSTFLNRVLTSLSLYPEGTHGQVFVCVQIKRNNIYSLPLKEILAGRWFSFMLDEGSKEYKE